MIDLRSDTVTKPTEEMLKAMLSAQVGDDVFEEDPSIIQLEQKIAKMFGKEAAVFCPSGTMTNQIAIKVHTNPGEEVICDRSSHVYNYEGGGIAFNSGCSVRLIEGDRGRFKANDIKENINPFNDHYPLTTLVSLENTSNRGGGSYYDFKEIENIKEVCIQNKLKLHLDGARIFNALTETNESTLDYGNIFDSISICLSKGLGAPVGSLLVGNTAFIKKARRIRKVFGGGMRQAGYLAAAGIYALDNHIERLKEDHQKAKELGECIANLPFVEFLLPVDTNIVIFKLEDKYPSKELISTLEESKIKVLSIGHQRIRMVTHLDISEKMIKLVNQVLKSI